LAFTLHCRLSQRIWAILFAGGILSVVIPLAMSGHADNPPADSIGAIEGESISVEGPVSIDVVQGQMRTILRSGSDVHVKSGQARIDLIEGGSIAICGPAHFSVLKSGAALTLALDTGTVHAHIENQPALTIYTAQIQARPVAIGDGPQDALIGLDSSGSMCIRANKGAVRIEQQFTGQSVIVPQSGDVSLTNGQLESLRNSAGHCSCELQQRVPSPRNSAEVSVLATAEEVKKKAAEQKTLEPKGVPSTANPSRSAERQEPVYQVFMPPLHYDASAKVQPDYDPSLIVLVRRVRVRPALIFQGRVEGDPVIAQTNPPVAPDAQKRDSAQQKASEESTWDRVRTFFRKLLSPSS
jgi:hypothetical protein